MNAETTAPTAATVSRVPTANGSRYLQQLCKHWSHKFAVTFDETHGVVPFDGATCTFDASPDILTMRVETAPDRIERMEDVVARHLERFAFRETLAIRWERAPAA